jgi:hypothetical protein
MSRKKIAALLIVFIMGSWCLYAEPGDGKDDENEIVIAVVLCLLTIGGLVGAVVALAEAPGDDTQPVLASSGNPVIAHTSSEQLKARSNRKVSGNPILDHIAIGVSDHDVYVGVRFGF